MTRRSAILLAILLPALAGCFPRPDYSDLPTSSVISRQVTSVTTTTVADVANPSAAEKAAIEKAMAQAGETGVRVRLTLPPNIQIGEFEARDLVRGLGLEPAIVRVEKGAPEAPATLEFLRVTLTAPECRQMVTYNEHATWREARPKMAFGCATYTNLSKSLTDPADLASPRDFGGPDGTNTAGAVNRYLRGTPKPLQHSATTSKTGSP